jgi:hypothetical protein
MGCKRPTPARKDDLTVNLHDLDDTGRLHYFYHSPSSDLPVRDVLNELGQDYKTEPYLEKQAENYCRRCMQPNIRGFLRSREKYLFLVTRMQKAGAKYFGTAYVVGYIEKRKTRGHEWRPGGFYAVLGEAKVYSFRDAYPLESMINFRHRPRKVVERLTATILDHFSDGRNILNECLIELERLKGDLPESERRKQDMECR